MTAPGTKTQEAISELAMILRAIGADGRIDPAEYSLLLHWRARWKTVIYRQHLRNFTETLDAALADGVFSPDEQQDLLSWTNRIEQTPDENDPPQAEPPPPWKKRTSWRQDLASDRQLAFLEDLGVEIQPGLNKGEASDLIDQAVQERNQRTVQEAAEALAAAYKQQQATHHRRTRVAPFVLILLAAIVTTWWFTDTPAPPSPPTPKPIMASAPQPPRPEPEPVQNDMQGARSTPTQPQKRFVPLIESEPWRATAPIRLRCQTVDGERTYTVVIAWAAIVDPDAAKAHIEKALQPDLDAILVDVSQDRDRFLSRVQRAAKGWRTDVVSCTLLPDPQ